MNHRREDWPVVVREAVEAHPELEDDAAEWLPCLAVLGALGAEQVPRALLKNQLLESLSRESVRLAPFWSRVAQLFDLGIDAVKQLFERAEQSSEWQSGPLPGVTLFHLQGGPSVATADCGLVRLEPGTQFPRHKHLGVELSLILEGRMRDSGRVYGPGDHFTYQAGSEHDFEVLPDTPLLFALVLFNGIELGGRVYRNESVVRNG